MAKDRARPFSKKHRKYWLPVLGGMIVIGFINVAIGMCAYDHGPDKVQRIDLVIPPPSAEALARRPRVVTPEGMLALGDIPVPVMRAFTKAFPQHAPKTAKKLDDGTIEITFFDKGQRVVSRFAPDGTPR